VVTKAAGGLKNSPTNLTGTRYLFVCYFFLDRSDFFVFFEGTTAARIPLNDEKFGMLCGII